LLFLLLPFALPASPEQNRIPKAKSIVQANEKIQGKILHSPLDPGNVGLPGLQKPRQSLLGQAIPLSDHGHGSTYLPLNRH